MVTKQSINFHIFGIHKIQQDSYAMLNKYELPLLKEEAEIVDTLRYAWEKVLTLGSQVQSHLVEIQPKFKKTLRENVIAFKTEVENFAKDYDTNGPMVTGMILKFYLT